MEVQPLLAAGHAHLPDLPPQRPRDPFRWACRRCPCVRTLGGQYVLLAGRDGRPLVTVGPHWSGTCFAQAAIFGGTYAFLSGTAIGSTLLTTAISYFFMLLTTALLWLTAATDPGIVTQSNMPRPDAEAGGRQLRFCDVCKVWQPERAAHCYDCGVCVRRHDHHCIWMGKCIGSGNMKWFIYFNMSWVCYFIFLFGGLAALPRSPAVPQR